MIKEATFQELDFAQTSSGKVARQRGRKATRTHKAVAWLERRILTSHGKEKQRRKPHRGCAAWLDNDRAGRRMEVAADAASISLQPPKEIGRGDDKRGDNRLPAYPPHLDGGTLAARRAPRRPTIGK
jgi:hypothetical protein